MLHLSMSDSEVESASDLLLMEQNFSEKKSLWSSLKSSLHWAILLFGVLRAYKESLSGEVQCSIRVSLVCPPKSFRPYIQPMSLETGPAAPSRSTTSVGLVSSETGGSILNLTGDLSSDLRL